MLDLVTLKASTETLAATTGQSFLATVSILQTGAAMAEQGELLESLCEIKREALEEQEAEILAA